MGYTHYLRNSEENNVWFSKEEWEKFSHLSARLIYSWFTDEIDNFDADAKSTYAIGTDNAGIFENSCCLSVASPEVLEKEFISSGFICIGFQKFGDYLYFERERKEGDNFFSKGFQFCKTNREEAYDALCVALYALAAHVTKERLLFTSDGDSFEVEEGLSFLEALTDIKFSYPQVSAVLQEAIQNAPTNEITELVSEVCDDLNIYTDDDLNELYAECPMELIRLFEREKAVTADYYAYTSPNNGERLISLSADELPDFIYNKIKDVCNYQENTKIKEFVEKYA